MARQTTRSGGGSKSKGGGARRTSSSGKRGSSATAGRGSSAASKRASSSARGGATSRKSSGARSSAASRAASKSRSASTARKASASRASRSNGKQKNLGDLFLETLKDVYHAEKQLVRALPKMAKAAQSPELRQAFEAHARETQRQAERLEKIFQMSGKRPQAKPCHGMMGLVEEGDEVMKEFKGSEALDAGLIGAAQAVEHYEIARYGTMREWASQHGMQEVVALLDETLAEEKKTDQLLTRIAESRANREAA
jgi:ferritin-like metal-binding protein YciE